MLTKKPMAPKFCSLKSMNLSHTMPSQTNPPKPDAGDYYCSRPYRRVKYYSLLCQFGTRHVPGKHIQYLCVSMANTPNQPSWQQTDN